MTGNSIIRVLVNEDGEKDKSAWHLSYSLSGDPAVLCTQEFYGYGQGRVEKEGVDFESKIGKVTCKKCRQIIKNIKGVKL